MIRVDALRTSGVVVLLTSAFLFCTRVNGQVDEPPALGPLKNVSVPGPRNLGEFVRNREAALALGKALFWDMQVGSDGVLACASCHFHAGVDSRSKNQLSPGLLRVAANRTENPDNAFAAGAPNYQLGPSNFPFHRLRDVNNRDSDVLFDTNDVASSQGAFQSEFVDIVPGSNIDLQVFQPDRVFNVHGTTVRRVEPRHTPSTINAVFNFRQFWDGRAQHLQRGESFRIAGPECFRTEGGQSVTAATREGQASGLFAGVAGCGTTVERVRDVRAGKNVSGYWIEACLLCASVGQKAIAAHSTG